MILYSDESILVIDKPSGLLCVPDGYQPDLPTLQSELASDWGKVMIVHRLDKDTSGVLVLARNPGAHRALDRQFAERKVTKTYHALCIGKPTWRQITVSAPLRVNGDRSHRTVVDPRAGKRAQTIVDLLEQYNGFCKVEAHPASGYTHQIRAHLASIGFPILGDPLYRLPPAIKDRPLDLILFRAFPRTALHAFSLSFTHPQSGEPISFTAPEPADFENFISSRQA